MMIADGGRAVPAYASPASISISVPQQYPRRVLSEEEVDRDLTLEQLIAMAQSQVPPPNKYGQKEQSPESKYLENLLYIQAHPPQKKDTKGGEQSDLDRILDAIFYASAVASIIPFPATAIGGRIGMLASGAGRAIQSGNKFAAARYISQMSRTADRGIGQYRKTHKRSGQRGSFNASRYVGKG